MSTVLLAGDPAKARTTHPVYRADIDGLRAIAVLSVVGFHAFPGWFKGGYVGVDIFFVISGFLISGVIFANLESNSFSYATFYARRIKRIFPALILVLMVCLACGWFVLPPPAYRQLGKHVTAGAGFVSNLALWNEAGYFDYAATAKPLLHLWSLGIEEQFYIVWPLLLGFVWKRKWNFLGLTLVVAIASFAVNIFTSGDSRYYSPLSRFWELMIGGTLAYILLHRPEYLGNRSNIQSAAGLALIVLAVLLLEESRAFPGWWAFLPTAGAFLVISAGPRAWLNQHLLANRLLVWVGLISYPLYLWHWPALYAVNPGNQLGFDRLGIEIATASQQGVARVSAILVSLVLSWLTYKLIEQPIRFRANTRKAVTVLAAASIVVLAGGAATYASRGFAYRIPQSLYDVLAYEDDYLHRYREGTCLLEAGQNESQFADCTTTPSIATETAVLVWGDSHAAHLSNGLEATVGQSARVTQRTASACPPILGYSAADRPHCTSINDHVMAEIAARKYDRVILAALWTYYDWKPLAGTIERLKTAGVRQIDLVGPVPQWLNSLPIELYRYAKTNEQSRPPSRMRWGLNERIEPLDAEMKRFAAQIGVNYVSAFDILCNEEGCLTMLGDGPSTLTAWDYSHLTAAGSLYLASRFPN